MNQPLLKVESISLRFGGIVALNKVSFEVKEGSVTAVIGPNGAGKTTMFNCITGFYRAQEGRLSFREADGQETDLLALLGGQWKAADLSSPFGLIKKSVYGYFGGTHRVARRGIARTFQNIRLFSEMSVIENLLVAQHLKVNRNLVAGLLLTPGFRRAEAEALELGFRWLQKLGLEKHANSLAGSLPYGSQRRLEIARAMCTKPRLVCLDEPAAGLNPRETRELSELILALRDQSKVTVLVIEHDMPLVMGISDHVVVLNYGEVIAAAAPAIVQNDPKVLAAYLGTEDEA